MINLKKKSPVPLRIISPICLIVWMGLIFCFSAQNATESSTVSIGLMENVIKFFAPNISPSSLESIISVWHFFVRKGAHFSIFAILGIFSFLSVVTYEKLNLFIRFLISAFISIGYAASDEYHQTFVSGRSGEIRDILIDSSGAILGIFISLIIYSVHKHKEKRGHKMKKKQYIELTEELQKRLNREKSLTEELQSENKELKAELTALNAELFHLRERLTDLESELPSPTQAESIRQETEAPAQLPEIPVIEERQIPEVSKEINFGAKIIGKIVLSSAEYCNKLTALGADMSVKELVNLILGRTEVAKAEILRLSGLDIEQNAKEKAMENEYAETIDYFKSVMAQK